MEPQIKEYKWIVKRKWTPRSMKQLKQRKAQQWDKMYG